jgi:hypothetical protein
MDPKLIQSSRMVKIAGVGLLLMSIIALTEAIVSVATLDASYGFLCCVTLHNVLICCFL